jgi:hypothetical protein
MYFWNIKKLKADLIAKPLTEKQTLPYLIAAVFFYTLIIELAIFLLSAQVTSEEYSKWDFISALFNLGSVIFGLKWLYQQNKGDSGSYFTQRYLAINWVASIRFMLVTALYLFVTVNLGEYPAYSWLGTLTYILFLVAYFWYVGKHIANVANNADY